MPLDKQRRLYYVCATRAKRHLSQRFYPTEMGRVLGPVLTPHEYRQVCRGVDGQCPKGKIPW